MDSLITLLQKYALPDLTPGYVKEFQKEVLAAMEDGKLTEEEIAQLEFKKEELGLTDEALAAIRLEVYAQAYKRVQEDAKVTDDEWEELEHIQDYLDLADKEIAGTKKELYRMRILTELRDGNMPMLYVENFLPNEGEVLHWTGKVKIYELSSSGKFNDWKKEGNGQLYITNKRVIITGPSETRSHPFGSLVEAHYTAKGITFHANRRRPVKVEYLDPSDKDIAASMLLAAIDIAKKAI